MWAERRGKWTGTAQRKHICHLEPLTGHGMSQKDHQTMAKLSVCGSCSPAENEREDDPEGSVGWFFCLLFPFFFFNSMAL